MDKKDREKLYDIGVDTVIARRFLTEAEFILVEKPHRRKAVAYVTDWDDLANRINEGQYGGDLTAWAAESYTTGCPSHISADDWLRELQSDHDLLLAFASRDLYGMDVLSSIEAAAAYCGNPGGYSHKKYEAMAAVEKLMFTEAPDEPDSDEEG